MRCHHFSEGVQRSRLDGRRVAMQESRRFSICVITTLTIQNIGPNSESGQTDYAK